MKKTVLTVLLVCGTLILSGCGEKPFTGDGQFTVNNDDATVAQGQSVVIDVLANDTYDPAQSEHSIEIVLDAISDPSVLQKGTAVINSDNRTITYTANAGASGDEIFFYSAHATGQKDNGNGGSNPFSTVSKEANITVHITDVPNAQPVADSQTVEIDCNVAAQPTVDIVLSGSDPENEPLTYEIVTNPTYGTLSPVNGNQVTYSADGTLCSSGVNDQFTFRVSDGVQYSEEANVTIIPVNAP